jgi:hypothetical protein
MFLSDDYFLYLLHCDVVLLDELLTLSSDAECGSLVKMLVAAIAGSNHAPEAQTSIVTEVLSCCVPDPDSPDPHVFGPPGSGSGSISQRYGSGSSVVEP